MVLLYHVFTIFSIEVFRGYHKLVTYNIGSVQPSIKVTHIIKHPIYIPEFDKINKFENIVKSITELIYKNSNENQRLSDLRDTLLPKLMNGEIDVSAVKI